MPKGKKNDKHNATIKDIAAAAGVSYATVSRALNDREGVNKKTREHVLKIAEEIGYRPNGIARSLVSKRSHTIALIVPDISYSFFSEIALAAEDIAIKQGYSMLLCNSRWNKDIENQLLEVVQEKCVDGIILHTATADNKNISEIKLPIVLIGWHHGEDFSYVEVDNKKGGFAGVECLIKNDYRRIACIVGRQSFSPNIDRAKGYKKALNNYNISIDPDMICFSDYSANSEYEAGYKEAERLLKYKKADAFFCGNDLIAMGVWKCANDQGLRVPEDIGICGFDNSSIAALPQVSLTSVAQPLSDMGKEAANILLQAISCYPQSCIHQRILPTELVIRNTSIKRNRN